MTQLDSLQPDDSGAACVTAAPVPVQMASLPASHMQLAPQPQPMLQAQQAPLDVAQLQHASKMAQLALPLALPNGAALQSTGVQGLPAGMLPPAADVSSAALLGHNPETGLIAVSSSASLTSSSAGGSGASGGGDGSNKTLYLGNLHPFVTEATLQELFAGLGGITELKVIKDKATGLSAGYGFAKFTDTTSAQTALDRVAKTVLFGQEARINWAFQREQKEEVATHYHVFVGDLSADVTDGMLHEAFQPCPGCSDARVMWDHATGRSRGYGFVSFRTREEADAAIQLMHGQFVGARRVRCGWAQHKTDGVVPLAMDPQILDRADPTNTNVYVGNLNPALTDVEVRRHFSAFGPVAEVKLYRKGSYGFVRYKSHADAVRAIVAMNGQALGGKMVKCSWGRHPSTPPSGVQASLMLAAASGLAPLTIGAAAGMLGPATMGSAVGLMGGAGTLVGMPMAAAGAPSLVHAGQVAGGLVGPAAVAAGSAPMLAAGAQPPLLPLDQTHQLQQVAALPYNGIMMPYGAANMQHSAAFFGNGIN